MYSLLVEKKPSDKGKLPLQIYNSGLPFKRVQMDILGYFSRLLLETNIF